VPELEWKMTAGVLNQTRLRPNIKGCQKGVSKLRCFRKSGSLDLTVSMCDL